MSLNNGKFYLNGDTDSCYYQVENGKIKFIMENEEQMREFYRVQCEADSSFEKFFDFEEWCERYEEDWQNAIPYIVHIDLGGIPRVAWKVIYTRSGDIGAYISSDYIDENNFESNNCRFTRVE